MFKCKHFKILTPGLFNFSIVRKNRLSSGQRRYCKRFHVPIFLYQSSEPAGSIGTSWAYTESSTMFVAYWSARPRPLGPGWWWFSHSLHRSRRDSSIDHAQWKNIGNTITKVHFNNVPMISPVHRLNYLLESTRQDISTHFTKVFLQS